MVKPLMCALALVAMVGCSGMTREVRVLCGNDMPYSQYIDLAGLTPPERLRTIHVLATNMCATRGGLRRIL